MTPGLTLYTDNAFTRYWRERFAGAADRVIAYDPSWDATVAPAPFGVTDAALVLRAALHDEHEADDGGWALHTSRLGVWTPGDSPTLRGEA